MANAPRWRYLYGQVQICPAGLLVGSAGMIALLFSWALGLRLNQAQNRAIPFMQLKRS